MELDTSVESLVYEECLTGEEAWVEQVEEIRGEEEETWEEQVEEERKLEEEVRKSEKDKSDGPPAGMTKAQLRTELMSMSFVDTSTALKWMAVAVARDDCPDDLIKLRCHSKDLQKRGINAGKVHRYRVYCCHSKEGTELPPTCFMSNSFFKT